MKKLICRFKGHQWKHNMSILDGSELSRTCTRCGRYEVHWLWGLLLQSLSPEDLSKIERAVDEGRAA